MKERLSDVEAECQVFPPHAEQEKAPCEEEEEAVAHEQEGEPLTDQSPHLPIALDPPA